MWVSSSRRHLTRFAIEVIKRASGDTRSSRGQVRVGYVATGPTCVRGVATMHECTSLCQYTIFLARTAETTLKALPTTLGNVA